MAILEEVYPKHPWRPWLFDRSPRNAWNRLADDLFSGDKRAKEIVLEYMDYLKEKYNIKKQEDWLGVVDHLNSHKELYRLAHFGSLSHLLRVVYTNHDWSKLPENKNKPLHGAIYECRPFSPLLTITAL